MKSRYVCPDEGRILYSTKSDIELNDSTIKLFYSRLGGAWSSHVSGTLAGTLHDDGNGVFINLNDDVVGLLLDYGALERLGVLLEEYYRKNGKPRRLK